MEYKTIKPTKIEVVATCGSNIHSCIAECIVLSTSQQCLVVLTHNEIKYAIDGMKITEGIYKHKGK